MIVNQTRKTALSAACLFAATISLSTVFCAPALAEEERTGISYALGPVDLAPNQTAKLTFTNAMAFCDGSVRVVLAFVDPAGKTSRGAGLRKEATLACGESLSLELRGVPPAPETQNMLIGIIFVLASSTWGGASAPIGSFQLLTDKMPTAIMLLGMPIRRAPDI